MAKQIESIWYGLRPEEDKRKDNEVERTHRPKPVCYPAGSGMGPVIALSGARRQRIDCKVGAVNQAEERISPPEPVPKPNEQHGDEQTEDKTGIAEIANRRTHGRIHVIPE